MNGTANLTGSLNVAGQATFEASSKSEIPIKARAATGQTANLIEASNDSDVAKTFINPNFGLVIGQAVGGSATPSIYVACGSAERAWVVWDANGGSLGMSFGSRASGGAVTEVMRIQDNGAFFATTIETLGTMRLYNYGIQRGYTSQKLDLGDTGTPAFEMVGGPSSFSVYFQVVATSASYPVQNLTTVTSGDDPNFKTWQNRVATTDATQT